MKVVHCRAGETPVIDGLDKEEAVFTTFSIAFHKKPLKELVPITQGKGSGEKVELVEIPIVRLYGNSQDVLQRIEDIVKITLIATQANHRGL